MRIVSWPAAVGHRDARCRTGKVLVLFHPAGGNTAKVAGLVAEGAGLIPGTEVRV
jgi:hypothetical protein